MPEISGIIQNYLRGSIESIGSEPPVIESKTITENGTYTAPSGVDGYSPVEVAVPIPEPVINPISIVANGTYTAPEGVDGYSPVEVAVPIPEPVIESKTITENGTYTAPEGVDGYSPIIVDVPLPENAYLLKSVANLPQAIASFTDGEEMVMPTLKVAIEPQQEGSGDPSPTNIRPISGWSNCVISVANAITDPTVEHTYTIDLDETRYGGELDVVSGVLTVDRVGVDLGRLTYSKAVDGLFRLNPDSIGAKIGSAMTCSIYNQGTRTDYSGWDARESTFGWLSTNEFIMFKDSRYIEASAFKTAMDGVQLVYELATPLTIQLSSTAVKSLLGSNNVWADTGDITDAEYFSKEV